MIVRLDNEPDVLESVRGELPEKRKEVLETDKDKKSEIDNNKKLKE